MTTYRFRVKYENDPRALWRDVVVGDDRTLDEFQTVVNESVGLDQGHLWFVGLDQDYWNSDVQYCRPGESGASPGTSWDVTEYDAGETTIGELARRHDLGEGDRICYLYDYGDEWRFYAICKAVDDDGDANAAPEVVNEKGGPVDQYAPPGERV